MSNSASSHQANLAGLSNEHLKMLRDGSGISDAVILDRGYKTIVKMTELRDYGFTTQQCKTTPGLLLPLYYTDGGNGLYVFRPDKPRVVPDKKTGQPKIIKYEMLRGAGIRIDCPPACQPLLANPSIRLWITEGQKKADALASHNLCAIDLLGVFGFKGRNDFGGVTFLADWQSIALKGREVVIVFDSDVMVNPNVKLALQILTELLQRRGAHIAHAYLPAAPNEKVGVDDYLLKYSVKDLESLIDAPRPVLKAAPAQVELLEETPDTIARPLIILKGKSYAAIWPYIRRTIRETNKKDGSVTRHNPPIVLEEQHLMIVRGDGVIFGEGARDVGEIGAVVRLPEIPRPEKLWSTRGVKQFINGKRPKPADVFKRIVDVVDRFIDFERSLTNQHTMCEFAACYILASWFLDAFNVIGYIWPNGERGSGKSQLLLILSELGFLGEFILAGGSFAALRDLADYGALLCFDDAENLTDPKTTDPDKRTLLLAGNRRGSTVPIKEQAPNGGWRTRHVNTYCARSFSAIRLPDSVLASRTITVPLIRSGDKKRANSDPKEYDLWPHDRQTLIDDLWALALTHLPDLGKYERQVNAESDLTGRNLEPWRAILAVALWLDKNNVAGLSDRMRHLSLGYQNERNEFESGDLTRLVVSAISAIFAVPAVLSEKTISTAEITEKTKDIAGEDESGVDPETINSRKVGWILKRLRLEKAGREDGKKGRMWLIKRADVERWGVSYSLDGNKKALPKKQNGENGENGETAGNLGLISLADLARWPNFPFPATWLNANSDQPIKVTGVQGKQNKQYYLSIESTTDGEIWIASQAGVPASEIFVSLNEE